MCARRDTQSGRSTRPLPRVAARLATALVLLACAAAPAHGETRVVTLPRARMSVEVLPARAAASQGIVVLASGDAGWRSLSKDLGERLSSLGYDVIGVDSKSYLSEATRRAGALAPEQIADDYLALLHWARATFPQRSVSLVGVSEGAGLAILAAADDRIGAQVAGVLGLGTPESVTLAWRFSDWTVWVTHKEPDEPSVPTAPYLAQVTPTPVAFIHATGDEFVTVAQAKALFAHAREPRRLDVLEAANHRFSDKRELLVNTVIDCLSWMRAPISAGSTR